MKTILSKFWAIPLALLLAVPLSTATLARPEPSGPAEDQFIGFHLVYEMLPPSMEELEAHPEDYPPEDRSQWTEYGSESIRVDGFGSLDIPREILIGQRQENGHYLFPGLDGYNAFLARGTNEDGTHYTTGYVDLADCRISIGGDTESLTGTLYIGLPLGVTEEEYYADSPDYGWTAYEVYQMADGTVYLNGHGSSFAGAGGFSTTHTRTYTTTENGESTTKTFEVTISCEQVSRLERAELRQYAGDDRLLSREELTPGDFSAGTLERSLAPGCDWLMVVETDTNGSRARSVYGAEELDASGCLSHQLVLLDDAGMGRPVYLTLK